MYGSSIKPGTSGQINGYPRLIYKDITHTRPGQQQKKITSPGTVLCKPPWYAHRPRPPTKSHGAKRFCLCLSIFSFLLVSLSLSLSAPRCSLGGEKKSSFVALWLTWPLTLSSSMPCKRMWGFSLRRLVNGVKKKESHQANSQATRIDVGRMCEVSRLFQNLKVLQPFDVILPKPIIVINPQLKHCISFCLSLTTIFGSASLTGEEPKRTWHDLLNSRYTPYGSLANAGILYFPQP